MELFHVTLEPTVDELYDGLQRSNLRRASKGRLTAQTVALVIAAAWSGTAYVVTGCQEIASLLIALAAAALIPVMWFVPLWQMKSIAKQTVESGAKMTMWVFEDGLDFGEEPPEQAYYSYRSFYCDKPSADHPHQTLVFHFASDEVVVVPKSQLTEEQWQMLLEKTVESDAVFSKRHR